MILEGICSVFFSLVRFLILNLSAPLDLPTWIDDAANLIGIGLLVFPVDVWAICLGSVASWTAIQFAWAVIEWIYKKIPGVS